jgi:hypothetical protein
MEFTKEHRQNLSKALKGREISWKDKIAEGMKGNQNAKGNDFSENSEGVYKGYTYHAKAVRQSDRTWVLYIDFVYPGTNRITVKNPIPGARKVTSKRLEKAYQNAIDDLKAGV